MFSPTKPGKFIQCNMTSSVGTESWPFDDGTGEDLWFINQNAYRWQIEMTITQQSHSSHLTREPFQYNGLDINIGDWIAGTSGAVALKIISILQKTETFVECIVEDVDRFNTFHDPTGNGLGMFSIGTCFTFEIGDDGMPILLPLPGAGAVSATFSGDLISRFRINNQLHRFRFVQAAHGFVVGDNLAMTASGLFELAGPTNLNVVGQVIDDNSGPDTFLLHPTTEIRENILPALVGDPGDIMWIDPATPGDITNVFPGAKAKPVFIKLSNAVASTVQGTVVDPTTTTGNILEINSVEVTFTGAGTQNLAGIISDIDALFSTHGVDALSVPAPTVTTGSVSNPFEDINGPGGPVVFSINGTPITLTTDVGGFGFPLIDDMIVDINLLSGTHGVTADNFGGNMRLTEPTGGAITIVDVDPVIIDGGQPLRTPFTTATGLVSAAPSVGSLLLLTNPTGGEILLKNETGTPMADLGVFSVANGRLPLGLVLDQSSRATESFIVADITERDALDVGAGDIVFVIDKGDGEWGEFLWDGSIFVVISTEESARVDSRSLSVTVTSATGASLLIGEVSSGSRVNPVTIEVITPFDAIPSISIGDDSVNDRLFEDALVDLATAGTYVSTPAFQYSGGNDTDIKVFFQSNGASVGEAKVTITYS